PNSKDECGEPLPVGAIARFRIKKDPLQFRNGDPPLPVGFFSPIISADREQIAAAIWDNRTSSIYVWELKTGKVLRRLSEENRFHRTIAFPPWKNELISCSCDQTLIRWNISDGKSIFKVVADVFTGGKAPGWLVLSPDGRTIVTSDLEWVPDGMLE